MPAIGSAVASFRERDSARSVGSAVSSSVLALYSVVYWSTPTLRISFPFVVERDVPGTLVSGVWLIYNDEAMRRECKAVPTAAERVVSVPPTRSMSLAPRLELSPLRINRSPVSNHRQTLRPLHSTSSSLTVVSPSLIHRSLASPFTNSHLHHLPFQQVSLDISSLLILQSPQ